MFNRDNLFGKGPRAGREGGGYEQPPQTPPRYNQTDTPMGGNFDDPRGSYGQNMRGAPTAGGYDDPRSGYVQNVRGSPLNRGIPERKSVGRPQEAAPAIQLQPRKVDDSSYTYGNL